MPLVDELVDASTSDEGVRAGLRRDGLLVDVRIDVFTLFPAAFDWYEEQVHVRKARALGHELHFWNYRDYTPLGHLQVDDTPYGGGAGMVLRIDVVCAALEAVFGEPAEGLRERRRVVELTPRGRQLDDALATELARPRPRAALRPLRGHRRARRQPRQRPRLDRSVRAERRRDRRDGADGRRPAQGRRRHLEPRERGQRVALPELGGGAEYPQYTRPAEFRGWTVPDVLLSGDHGAVARWRAAQVESAGGEDSPR